MKQLKKDLMAAKKEIKSLQQRMEKLIKAVEKGSTAAVKTVAKKKPVKKKTAVAKPVKKVVVKKKAPIKKKAAAKKKAPARKAVAVKKAKGATSTDKVLGIIKRSKKGVDVPTLKKKTGFEDKKVRNIVFRAAKEGKIKKSGRGIYVGA